MARKHGKKYLEAKKKVSEKFADHKNDAKEALTALRDLAFANFDETVEAAFNLGVDPRHADQMVRGAVLLPHGIGQSFRVIVFAKGEKAKEAEQAGADAVGAEDLVEKIQGGWMDFDRAIATPDMMPAVSKIGKLLGPRGLMPNPKLGTVTMDVAQAVKDNKLGKVEFRTEKTGIVHAPIGKKSFEPQKLYENFQTLVDTLMRAKPSSSKGMYMRKVTVSTAMGPGIQVEPQSAMKEVEA